MICPVRPIRSFHDELALMKLARSGPVCGALVWQMSALERRRKLTEQQKQLGAGEADPLARPPYPFRRRPPS